MKKEVLNYVIKETNALINAGSTCKEAKEAAEKWLKAVGTPDEAAETERYLKELEEDIEGIDDLIAFASSPLAVRIFGEEKAKGFLAHAKELKKTERNIVIAPPAPPARISYRRNPNFSVKSGYKPINGLFSCLTAKICPLDFKGNQAGFYMFN